VRLEPDDYTRSPRSTVNGRNEGEEGLNALFTAAVSTDRSIDDRHVISARPLNRPQQKCDAVLGGEVRMRAYTDSLKLVTGEKLMNGLLGVELDVLDPPRYASELDEAEASPTDASQGPVKLARMVGTAVPADLPGECVVVHELRWIRAGQAF
jgi:hypothetical protein